jgi:uncharacterized protein (UPF0248 family)
VLPFYTVAYYRPGEECATRKKTLEYLYKDRNHKESHEKQKATQKCRLLFFVQVDDHIPPHRVIQVKNGAGVTFNNVCVLCTK